MSILSTIKSIFSSKVKPVDDILDKDNGLLVRAGGWIDNLVYTDQEAFKDNKEIVKHASEAHKQIIDTVIDHVKSTSEENTQRSLTRRLTALYIIRIEIFLILASVIVWPFNQDYSRFIWQVASSNLMFGAFCAVIVFFFGSYGINQHIIKPLSNRKSSK